MTTYERTYSRYQRAPDPTLAAASALRLVVHNKQHLANRPGERLARSVQIGSRLPVRR